MRSYLIIPLLILHGGCGQKESSSILRPKISLVNSPTDIVTLGSHFLADEIKAKSKGEIQPRVFHSGVLSGGKGIAEIEMCQQGSIEMHVTSTAYLANLVPKMSVVSLPFSFRDMDQLVGFTKNENPVLDEINRELNTKNLHVIAWWPRGFRQLTNSKRPVETLEDIKGIKFRVMNNQLFVDNMNAMGAHPVPMEWGEVYNSLQLKTIDGQENAEDVIYANRLYEIQKYMTIWDYSTDLEIVLVSLKWWNNLSEEHRKIIQHVADASVGFQEELLRRNTLELRRKIAGNGTEIHYLSDVEKQQFRESVEPVWDKYERIFTRDFVNAFLEEVGKY